MKVSSLTSPAHRPRVLAVEICIDVEAVDAYDPDLLAITMCAHEQRAILDSERPPIAFLGLWTKKEAALKCIGTGLVDHLPDLFGNEAEALGCGCLTTLSDFEPMELEIEAQPTLPRMRFSSMVSENMRYVYTACWLFD